MEPMNLTINSLPAFTYRWLHMNETTIKDAAASRETICSAQIPPQVTRVRRAANPLTQIPTGSGKDIDRLLLAAGAGTIEYSIPAGETTGKDALRLGFHYTEASEEGEVTSLALRLGEGSQMTVVMDFKSKKEVEGMAAVQVRADLNKGATLNLIQLIRVDDAFTFINDIGGKCAEDATVNVYHLFLGGKNVYQGCRFDLAGSSSAFNAETGYVLGGDRTLDMNYYAYHTGKKTSCNLNAYGVLSDQARKIYRGTIDFVNGCAGSTGDELENVLLMSEDVVNQTIPLILCAEEDVVGNHGATIGRLDEDLLFYAETRGMEPEEIYSMMAHARIDALIRKIPDIYTRHQLYVDLGEEVE